jgi:hypothetical protein
MANDESKAKHLKALEALWARLSETEKAEVLARSDSIEKEQNFRATASIKPNFNMETPRNEVFRAHKKCLLFHAR